MSYEILRTGTADEQIRDIAHYLMALSGGQAAALAFLDRLDAATRRLADFPRSGSVPRWGTLARQGYRFVTAGDYLVLYKVDDANRRVFIHAVVHGTREYWRLVGGSTVEDAG